MTGMITPYEAAREMATIPTDPAALVQWARQHQLQATDAANRYSNMYGTVTGVPTGAGTQFTAVPPAGKPGATQPTVPAYGSREFWNETITGLDTNKTLPDGSPNPRYLTQYPMPKWQAYGYPAPPGESGGPSTGGADERHQSWPEVFRPFQYLMASSSSFLVAVSSEALYSSRCGCVIRASWNTRGSALSEGSHCAGERRQSAGDEQGRRGGARAADAGYGNDARRHQPIRSSAVDLRRGEVSRHGAEH
jgi:hypothetical protein